MSAMLIDDAAVDFLRHALVEAAVAGLHMEDRDLAALGGYGGQAAVGVAQDQDRVGRFRLEHPVGGDDDVADRFGGGCAGGFEEDVRRPDAEILEEDLVELVIVILAGVDEFVVAMPVEHRDRRGTGG